MGLVLLLFFWMLTYLPEIGEMQDNTTPEAKAIGPTWDAQREWLLMSGELPTLTSKSANIVEETSLTTKIRKQNKTRYLN